MRYLSKKLAGFAAVVLIVTAPAGMLRASGWIPADYTGDHKVDLADFSAMADGWENGFVYDDLERLAFHWLMDATNGGDPFVDAVYMDRARYEPGQLSTVTVRCRNDTAQPYTGPVGLYVTCHGHLVYSASQSVHLDAFSSTAVSFHWTAPTADFQGYLVEAWLANGSHAVTAADVSSDWKRYPRYGYMTEFYTSTTPARNTAMLDTLARDYHINSLQYYDWMWRHENVIKRDAAGRIVSPWTDWRGAGISFEVLQDSIAKANARGMAAMPYFQIYMALDNYETVSGVSPQWGLYADAFHTTQYHHDAGTNMWLFNPGNVNWQNHLCDEYTDALVTMDWAGIHLDQLGNIGAGSYYDYPGNPVDLEWALGNMVNRTKDHLDYLEAVHPAAAGRDAVVFNIVDGGVGHWAVDAALSGKADIVYSELWSESTYGGVADFVRYARARSGRKPVVLAAYINRYEDTGGMFDPDSVLLADAAFFAGGAFHIELGDGDNMLAQEFFPARDKVMSEDLKNRLKDYYTFITAYERLLFAPDLRFGDGGLQWISLEGYAVSGNGASDTIWFLNRGTADYEIFHLVNLLGNDDQWRNAAETPPVATDIPVKLRLGPDAAVSGVYTASPDVNGGIMQPLPYTTGVDSAGDYLSVTLPRLAYWGMLYIERTVQEPADGRYEAERAIKQGVGVNANHEGYSGTGFVDRYAEVNDSVNFHVTVEQEGMYSLGFRYANGGSAATRSLIVNGEILANIDFAPLGNWETWATATRPVFLEAGVHQVTLYYGGWNSGAINLDYLQSQ